MYKRLRNEIIRYKISACGIRCNGISEYRCNSILASWRHANFLVRSL